VVFGSGKNLRIKQGGSRERKKGLRPASAKKEAGAAITLANNVSTVRTGNVPNGGGAGKGESGSWNENSRWKGVPLLIKIQKYGNFGRRRRSESQKSDELSSHMGAVGVFRPNILF